MDHPSSVTLRVWFEARFIPARFDLCAGTLDQYRIAIGLWQRAGLDCGYKPLVGALSVETLRKFLAWYLAHGAAPATVNKKRSLLIALWAQAAEEGLAPPCEPRRVRTLREPRREPDSWSLDDLAALLHAANSTRLAAEWESLIRICYETGLRIGAVWRARPGQLDARARVLVIPPEHQKTAREQRFELSADLVDRLARFAPDRTRLIPFPWLHQRTLYAGLGRLLVSAGLPATRRDKFHKLRRTHATQVCRALGMPLAQRALGHTSEQMTRRYVDVAKLDTPSVLSALPPLAAGGQLRLFG